MHEIKQPLDFEFVEKETDTTHVDALARLESLNQFIKAELNLCSTTKNAHGLINLINGCFISESKKEIPNKLFDFSRKNMINGLKLTWTDSAIKSSYHHVFLSGDQIEEFVTLMEKQSEQYN